MDKSAQLVASITVPAAIIALVGCGVWLAVTFTRPVIVSQERSRMIHDCVVRSMNAGTGRDQARAYCIDIVDWLDRQAAGGWR